MSLYFCVILIKMQSYPKNMIYIISFVEITAAIISVSFYIATDVKIALWEKNPIAFIQIARALACLFLIFTFWIFVVRCYEIFKTIISFKSNASELVQRKRKSYILLFFWILVILTGNFITFCAALASIKYSSVKKFSVYLSHI